MSHKRGEFCADSEPLAALASAVWVSRVSSAPEEGQLAGDMIAGGMILCVKLFLSRDRILEFGGSVYEFIIKELT